MPRARRSRSLWRRVGLLVGVAVLASACSSSSQAARPSAAGSASIVGHVAVPSYEGKMFPPWSHGANNPALNKGLTFTVPEIDDLADFHGSLTAPKLVLYVGGNYYFAMPALISAFQGLHPSLRGAIYYETLPPGTLLQQLQAGGRITVGNMTWQVRPDVYGAGLSGVTAAVHKGLLQGPPTIYATNSLAIMVPKGNPAHITSLSDLGKPGVRLSMPNGAAEGVTTQIKTALTKAGGSALVTSVYSTKVANGQTIITKIHHRQTPLFLMQGLAQAGITWRSEAIAQEADHHPISYVAIPAADNVNAPYAAAVVTGAAHPVAAAQWLSFLASPTALHIFEHYGVKPYTAK